MEDAFQYGKCWQVGTGEANSIQGKGNAIGKAYQSISYRFMERYVFSAKNLLAHFQYGVKGTIPFTLDWDKESTKKLGDLDKDAVKYVKYVSGIARRRSKLCP